METIFDYEHPFVCTDAVVFTVNTRESDSYRKLPETSLKILLYQRDAEPCMSKWCLPGGFLNIDEMPEDNIQRKLSEKSNVDKCWLEQLYTFCDIQRDPRARVISIGYLGLMSEEASRQFDHESVWFKVIIGAEGQLTFENDQLTLVQSDLGFDHYQMIQAALERLRSKIVYSSIIFHLLPERFTLTQLQNVYEVILNKKDQPANFRRKVAGLVQETEEYTKDKGHRPAKLYMKRMED